MFGSQGQWFTGVLTEQSRWVDSHQASEYSYMHAMASEALSPSQASEAMWGFVASNINTANAVLGPGGTFTSESLDLLGDAIHTVQDWTSPMHTSASGDPLVWRGVFHGGLQHWWGENSPEVNWAAIGRAIRLTMAAFMQANPELAKRKGLTGKTFEAECARRISGYVASFFASQSQGQESAVIREDARRQCALGNRAGCE